MGGRAGPKLGRWLCGTGSFWAVPWAADFSMMHMNSLRTANMAVLSKAVEGGNRLETKPTRLLTRGKCWGMGKAHK
jgi:hypothetical protein